ncbi:MAG: hypothetical protein HQ569_06255 [Actinobacteria bacterium]|nr:hypothetical protein [Actinomycetota bacterium]
MKISIYNKYKEDFSTVINNLFENIENLEKEIKNINLKSVFSFDIGQSSIRKLKSEIIKYFQHNNGALGYDIFLIKYILRQILIYIFIVKEKNLSVKEKNTCGLEIEVRFYFFLNCIYNFKEKLENFFIISVERNRISFEDTILSEDGKRYARRLFNESYVKIKDYCDARGCLVHDIYELKYDLVKNEIKIYTSKFKLSNENITGRGNRKYYFNLNHSELINLVEDMQIIRKKTIEFGSVTDFV